MTPDCPAVGGVTARVTPDCPPVGGVTAGAG
jgi:hypothetical protein